MNITQYIKRFFCAILIGFLYFNLSAQKIIQETVDYTAFPIGIENQFIISSITNGHMYLHPSQPIPPVTGSQLFFPIAIENSANSWWEKQYGLKFNKGDTGISIDWDIQTKDISKRPFAGHTFGKISLDKINNILYVEKTGKENNKFTTIKRKYKIIKLTEKEIKLYDISNPEWKRVYYFKKGR